MTLGLSLLLLSGALCTLGALLETLSLALQRCADRVTSENGPL